MHEAEGEHPPPTPPPPQHRATNNLASGYFKGVSSKNADLWIIFIENWRTYRQMNEDQIKAAIPIFFRDGTALKYQALADNKKRTIFPFQSCL